MKISLIFSFLFLFGSLLVDAQEIHQSGDSLIREVTLAIRNNQYPKIYSVLIAQGDHLNYEEYFNGYQRDSLGR